MESLQHFRTGERGTREPVPFKEVHESRQRTQGIPETEGAYGLLRCCALICACVVEDG